MPKILLVDDEVSNLEALKGFFETKRSDWFIATAQNEQDFMAMFNEIRPDVVISDLVMEKDDSGMTVLLYAKGKDPLVMVILVTAFEKKLDRYRAFDLGAFDCIQKNTAGIIPAEEILVKTKAALLLRELTLKEIESQKRLAFLKRYFDPQIFETVESNPDLLNIHSRVLTICFWDIRGFSLLCEILKAYPRLISDFLNAYFDMAATVIFKHQGVLDKFIGDGVMALFGCLNQSADEGQQDAIDAVSATIDMKIGFNGLLEEWMEKWVLHTPQTIDLGLGCGIHTGEVLVGNVGTEIRDQYTALGPHVNFAQRLEGRSKRGQILVSASTRARVKSKFVLNQIGTIADVKNMPGEYEIFEVRSPG